MRRPAWSMPISLSPHRFDGRVLTNFEKKGLAAGRVIHDFTYRKV